MYNLDTPDRLGFLEPKTIVHCMKTNANVELDAGTKTFASGLLPDLIAALRLSRNGDLVAVISGDPSIGPELETWCRFTRNSLVDIAVEGGRTRWVLRYGEALENVGEDRPIGSRLWLSTNFDSNLSCGYLCLPAAPKAPRRPPRFQPGPPTPSPPPRPAPTHIFWSPLVP